MNIIKNNLGLKNRYNYHKQNNRSKLVQNRSWLLFLLYRQLYFSKFSHLASQINFKLNENKSNET